MNGAALLALVAAWMMGLVLAQGFWSTAFAALIPPWAWYLVAEKLMQLTSFI